MGRTAKQLQDIDRHAIEQNVKRTHGSQSRYRFALSLSTLLAERGIEQKEFARLIPAADSTVSDYCMGKKDPKLSTIVRMAEILDVDCHRLLTGTDAAYKNICEGTGLTQKTADTLHLLTAADESIANTVNDFLSTFYISFWKSLCDYKEKITTAQTMVQNATQQLRELLETDEEAAQQHALLSIAGLPGEREVKYSLFHLLESFKDILNINYAGGYWDTLNDFHAECAKLLDHDTMAEMYKNL